MNSHFSTIQIAISSKKCTRNAVLTYYCSPRWSSKIEKIDNVPTVKGNIFFQQRLSKAAGAPGAVKVPSEGAVKGAERAEIGFGGWRIC